MARHRLNKLDRNILRSYAQRKVSETPLGDLDDRLATAEARHTAARNQLADLLRRKIEAKFPPAEMDVLAKYNFTTFPDPVVVVDLSTGKARWDRPFMYVTNDDRNEAAGYVRNFNGCWVLPGGRKARVFNKESLEQLYERSGAPKVPGNYKDPPLGLTAEEMRLFNDWADAHEERQLRRDQRLDELKRIYEDYDALIDHCRTFEQLVELWPEAEACRPDIIGTGTALTTVSAESITRIQANVATRKAKTATTPTAAEVVEKIAKRA